LKLKIIMTKIQTKLFDNQNNNTTKFCREKNTSKPLKNYLLKKLIRNFESPFSVRNG